MASSLPPLPPPVLPSIGELRMTRIADLKPFLKNINCKFMVIRLVEDAKSTKEGGFIYSYRVSDESGVVIANFWNEIGASIRVGDILLMAGGFVTMYKNTIRIACKLGTLIKLDRFKMVFNDQLDVSRPLWLPNPENEHELVKQEEPSRKILKK